MLFELILLILMIILIMMLLLMIMNRYIRILFLFIKF